MIVIIDYQMGNLRSVQKACERVNAAAQITADPRRVEQAEKVILPGVGAFQDAIAELRRRELVEPIRGAIAAGKPFLGICLGLQLLFERSFEDGEHEGLGVLAGEVRRFAVPRELKVPHMGWNSVRQTQKSRLWDGVGDGEYFYFVHSYCAVPADESLIAGTAEYPQPFCAAIARDNLFATQFHPEKSQQAGLQLLRNFAAL